LASEPASCADDHELDWVGPGASGVVVRTTGDAHLNEKNFIETFTNINSDIFQIESRYFAIH